VIRQKLIATFNARIKINHVDRCMGVVFKNKEAEMERGNVHAAQLQELTPRTGSSNAKKLSCAFSSQDEHPQAPTPESKSGAVETKVDTTTPTVVAGEAAASAMSGDASVKSTPQQQQSFRGGLGHATIGEAEGVIDDDVESEEILAMFLDAHCTVNGNPDRDFVDFNTKHDNNKAGGRKVTSPGFHDAFGYYCRRRGVVAPELTDKLFRIVDIPRYRGLTSRIQGIRWLHFNDGEKATMRNAAYAWEAFMVLMHILLMCGLPLLLAALMFRVQSTYAGTTGQSVRGVNKRVPLSSWDLVLT
jgi:hypothetical protein